MGWALEAKTELGQRSRGGRMLGVFEEQWGWKALSSGLEDEVRKVLEGGNGEQLKDFEQNKKLWFILEAVAE